MEGRWDRCSLYKLSDSSQEGLRRDRLRSILLSLTFCNVICMLLDIGVDSKARIFLESRKPLRIIGLIIAGEGQFKKLCTQLMATTRSISQALYSVVYVTVPNSTVAQQIAREVVKGKYAACVNIVPGITSIYEWEDKLEEDKESLLVMKTKSAALDALKAKVLSMHPYKVPEFIALPIESGSESYLQWIDKQVNS